MRSWRGLWRDSALLVTCKNLWSISGAISFAVNGGLSADGHGCLASSGLAAAVFFLESLNGVISLG